MFVIVNLNPYMVNDNHLCKLVTAELMDESNGGATKTRMPADSV